MKEKVLFFDMFSDLTPPEELYEALSQAVVVDADLNPSVRSLVLTIQCPIYISDSLRKQISADIERAYGLRHFTLSIRYPSDQLSAMPEEDLRQLFVEHNAMARAVLAGAKWHWEENKLVITLKANGREFLEKYVREVKAHLSWMFDCSVDIEMICNQSMTAQDLFVATQKMRDKCIAENPVSVVEVAPKIIVKDSPEMIFGKSFSGKVIPMKDLDLNMGKVIVEGKVIAVDHKELEKRKAIVVKFDITDNTSSVRVSRFLEQKDAKTIVEQIKPGCVVKVSGKLIVDNFTNEVVLKPNAIMPGFIPGRKDLAPGNKRVELHLHTCMSNMDALTDTKAAIKQAAAWGHRAIAITDHGCVQSFTDAYHVVEKPDKAPKVAGTGEPIKVLYGCEGYYINDVDDLIAVRGNKDYSLDDAFVAFDIETTGLYSRRDRIIEIGAVRMKNGVEVDRFESFVNPGIRLEKRTTDLTGITDDMLRGAPSIEEVLPRFMEFVGECPLVAHNALFDTGFIRKYCTDLGIEYNLTSVDTLAISQNVLPKLGKYKLDVIAKYFDLEDFNHHRAGDDALICGKIMLNLIPILRKMGVESLQQINPAIAPLRPQFRNDDTHLQHIVLFAKNQLGLRNLYRLISEANLYHFRKFPRIF